ncbi:hypothetical protein [Actinoallomurus soli]|uniref:hypothetical protein n=1 Tax=Actinoallomurus soli TaxID=2952535 RepID=UPI002092863A|nr:hypothetical protein [Actinoallomurus soli]MCO5968305.1 hypothetical protein [Actinoallomurus soli]
MRRARAATRRHLPTSPFKAPPVTPVEEFAVRDKVSHDRYGLGVVTAVEDGVAVSVDFGSQTERIPAPYAKLFKL